MLVEMDFAANSNSSHRCCVGLRTRTLLSAIDREIERSPELMSDDCHQRTRFYKVPNASGGSVVLSAEATLSTSARSARQRIRTHVLRSLSSD